MLHLINASREVTNFKTLLEKNEVIYIKVFLQLLLFSIPHYFHVCLYNAIYCISVTSDLICFSAIGSAVHRRESNVRVPSSNSRWDF